MPDPFPLTSLADLADGVSDVKCHWSDGLVQIALFDNILYTINKFKFAIDL
jgi:hypothetical protein